jgi:hypothetical protein
VCVIWVPEAHNCLTDMNFTTGIGYSTGSQRVEDATSIMDHFLQSILPIHHSDKPLSDPGTVASPLVLVPKVGYKRHKQPTTHYRPDGPTQIFSTLESSLRLSAHLESCTHTTYNVN